MGLTNKLLLIFVILGAVNIIILLIIKSKSKSNKNKKDANLKKKSGIKAFSYDDEDLVCMVDNNLELEYGYACTDKDVFEQMNEPHRNVYSLLWFDTEMKSGGVGDYLFSSSNITMDYIAEAFESVGAKDILEGYKKLLEENNILEAVSQIKIRSVDEYSHFMSQFDFSEFNELYIKRDLRPLIANYIRQNICDFTDLSEEEHNILKEMEEDRN